MIGSKHRNFVRAPQVTSAPDAERTHAFGHTVGYLPRGVYTIDVSLMVLLMVQPHCRFVDHRPQIGMAEGQGWQHVWTGGRAGRCVV
jgi:hypothetical protein